MQCLHHSFLSLQLFVKAMACHFHPVGKLMNLVDVAFLLLLCPSPSLLHLNYFVQISVRQNSTTQNHSITFTLPQNTITNVDDAIAQIFQLQLARLMDSLKAIFTDHPAKQLHQKKQDKKSLPLIGNLDYCYRYRPQIDRNTLEEQLEHTQREVIQYFPREIREQYRDFERTTKYMTIAFWTVSLSFAGLCHRIRIISRLLGEGSWKMFSFKLMSLVGPYMAMDRIMPTAQTEQMDLLWKSVSERYKRYKYTGDILQLNSSIALVGQGLSSNQQN